MFFPTESDYFKERFKLCVIVNVVYSLWSARLRKMQRRLASQRLLLKDQILQMTMDEFCRFDKPTCKIIAQLSYEKLELQYVDANVDDVCSVEEIFCVLVWMQNQFRSRFAEETSLKWVLSENAYQFLS